MPDVGVGTNPIDLLNILLQNNENVVFVYSISRILIDFLVGTMVSLIS